MSLFQSLLADIESLPGDTATKRCIIEMMLTQYAGARLHISTRDHQREQGRRLLATIRKADTTPRDQRRILASRLGISRDTAWRWVRELETDDLP